MISQQIPDFFSRDGWFTFETRDMWASPIQLSTITTQLVFGHLYFEPDTMEAGLVIRIDNVIPALRLRLLINYTPVLCDLIIVMVLGTANFRCHGDDRDNYILGFFFLKSKPIIRKMKLKIYGVYIGYNPFPLAFPFWLYSQEDAVKVIGIFGAYIMVT